MAGDRPGRRNKGDRVVRTTRLPRLVDEEIRRLAAQQGLGLSEYVSSVMARHTGHPEYDALTTQQDQELPLTG